MAKKQFEQYLSRRMMGETGWVYFCRQCGLYLPEGNFYKSKDSKWGLDSRCKIHHSRKDEDDDKEINNIHSTNILGDLERKKFRNHHIQEIEHIRNVSDVSLDEAIDIHYDFIQATKSVFG